MIKITYIIIYRTFKLIYDESNSQKTKILNIYVGTNVIKLIGLNLHTYNKMFK